MKLGAVTTLQSAKRAALLFEHVALCVVRPADQREYHRTKRHLPAFVDVIGDDPSTTDSCGLIRRVAAVYTNTRPDDLFIPIYESSDAFMLDYGPGPIVAYTAAIRNLPVVIERRTSWEQVAQFRKDEDAVWKYRNMRLWFDLALRASSIDEATDIIGSRLDHYTWAIRKHGFETAVQTVSLLYHPKTVAPIALTGAAAGALTHPLAGVLTAGLLLASEVSVLLAKRMIQLEDLKRGEFSEVAVLYDAVRQLGQE